VDEIWKGVGEQQNASGTPMIWDRVLVVSTE
jgi:hypothetical protein